MKRTLGFWLVLTSINANALMNSALYKDCLQIPVEKNQVVCQITVLNEYLRINKYWSEFLQADLQKKCSLSQNNVSSIDDLKCELKYKIDRYEQTRD